MKVPFLDLSLQHRALRTEALAALAATYDATRFCLGKDVEDFERNFAATLGYPRALGMNSGTAPLHVACMLAGFGPGDEIVTAPFTFISSAWGINYVGAKPVFADIEEGTFNLDPGKLATAITPRTKGIIVVHLFGQPARMDEIMAVARQHKLFVIEDCAQAVGAKYRGTPVGITGDVGTFSFYPTKNLGGCGEGGALVSRREDLHTTARHIRVHGSDRRYYHDIIGGNFRMDGFQGALLNVKLPHLAAWTARRQAIAARYLAGIKLADVRLPEQPAYGKSVFHQFTIRHPRRDALREHLTKHEIGTDLIYPVPLHLQKCYANLGYGPGSFPVAETAAATCVSLPLFPELTDAQVDYVVANLNAFPLMTDGIRLKVCGLTNAGDAKAATEVGADYLGFILIAESPRHLSLDKFGGFASQLPKGRKVAVSIEPTTTQLAEMNAAGFDFFQIHFRHDLPITTVASWAEAVGIERLWLAPKLPPGVSVPAGVLPFAKTFLFDTYHVRKFGGTGETSDWGKFSRHRKAHPKKTWILSGGLNPVNIGAALRQSGARFVDVNSGVELAPGVKDRGKLQRLVERLHERRS